MDIIFYHPAFDAQFWILHLQQALPGARVRQWRSGDNDDADFALIWLPPVEMLSGRKDLKAIFVLGAGVDAILTKLSTHPDILPAGVPLYRLKDTGMGQQMQEYAVSQVLRWYRRFDDYQVLKTQNRWERLDNYQRESFTIGILGAGVLGMKVAKSLLPWGFPLRCWSRTRKTHPGIESFAGIEELDDFLTQTQVLINLLPNTQETVGIINRQLLDKLRPGAFVLNLARGTHLIEDDLLAALNTGQIKGAMLDVFTREPLEQTSPLWRHPHVAITPHIAAVTCPLEAIDYIAGTIRELEMGRRPQGEVDLERGY